jgi:hypothetical protein
MPSERSNTFLVSDKMSQVFVQVTRPRTIQTSHGVFSKLDIDNLNILTTAKSLGVVFFMYTIYSFLMPIEMHLNLTEL